MAESGPSRSLGRSALCLLTNLDSSAARCRLSAEVNVKTANRCYSDPIGHTQKALGQCSETIIWRKVQERASIGRCVTHCEGLFVQYKATRFFIGCIAIQHGSKSEGVFNVQMEFSEHIFRLDWSLTPANFQA